MVILEVWTVKGIFCSKRATDELLVQREVRVEESRLVAKGLPVEMNQLDCNSTRG
jgi:hypothetical protein